MFFLYFCVLWSKVAIPLKFIWSIYWTNIIWHVNAEINEAINVLLTELQCWFVVRNNALTWFPTWPPLNEWKLNTSLWNISNLYNMGLNKHKHCNQNGLVKHSTMKAKEQFEKARPNQNGPPQLLQLLSILLHMFIFDYFCSGQGNYYLE